MALIKDILHGLLDLFFPQKCVHCRRPLAPGEQFVCTDCAIDIPFTYFNDPSDNPITKKFWGRLPLKYGFSYMYFVKNGIAQSILHELKYKGNKEIGIFFGQAMAARMQETGFPDDFDVIIPVPLHPKKQQIRGYNQAEILAREISTAFQKTVITNAVIRTRFNPTQTKMDRIHRWENVENLFSVVRPEKLKGKHILLVDDVLTTGSTLEALADSIITAVKDTEFSIATLALAPRGTI